MRPRSPCFELGPVRGRDDSPRMLLDEQGGAEPRPTVAVGVLSHHGATDSADAREFAVTHVLALEEETELGELRHGLTIEAYATQGKCLQESIATTVWG